MRQTIEVNGVTITVGEPTPTQAYSRSSTSSWILSGIIIAICGFCGFVTLAAAVYSYSAPAPMQPLMPSIGSSSQQQVVIQPNCTFGCIVNGPVEVKSQNDSVVDQSTTTTTSTNTSTCVNIVSGVCVQAYGSQTGRSGGASVAPQPSNAQYLPSPDAQPPQQQSAGLGIVPLLAVGAVIVGAFLLFGSLGKRKNY